MLEQLIRRLGVSEGEGVLVESRRGSVRFDVLVSGDIRPDTLFAPFHWGGKQVQGAVCGLDTARVGAALAGAGGLGEERVDIRQRGDEAVDL